MVPDESDMLSTTKEKVIANIDVAMGGHVAETIFGVKIFVSLSWNVATQVRQCLGSVITGRDVRRLLRIMQIIFNFFR